MLNRAETNLEHDTGRADAIESGRGDMQSDVGMLFMGMIGSYVVCGVVHKMQRKDTREGECLCCL